MITVTLAKDKSGALIGYQVSGHAQQAPHGEDIVCAAVSVWSIGIANGLERQGVAIDKMADADGYLTVQTAIEQTPEAALVRKALLETYVESICAIAAGDGASYVQLLSTDEEVDSCFK